MKKLILFLSIILSIGFVKSNNLSITNTYVQTQIIKSIFENSPHTTKWSKSDSTNVSLDLLNKKKITILNNDSISSYNVRSIRLNKYNIANVYNMKGIDNNKREVDIQVIHYNDNNFLLIIAGERKILRYKILQNS